MSHKEKVVTILHTIAVCALAALVLLAGIAFVTFRTTPKVVDLSSVEQARIPTAYRFVPKIDITAYELAMAAIVTTTSTQYLPVVKPWYDAMPDNVKRHFEVPTDTTPPPTPPAAPAPHQH